MTEETKPLSRDVTLAQYRPIRASIQAVLAEAVSHFRKPDLERAAKHLDLIDRAQLEDEEARNMLLDVALFEPSPRGRRAIDRFVAKHGAALEPADRDIARRLTSAFFSIFRVAGWHEAGGVWLEDLLVPERRVWLMDENLEASAPEALVIAMRVFDVGPFYAGFGIVVRPDSEAVALCTAAASRGESLPVRHSLAAALYGDAIAETGPLGVLSEMLELFEAIEEAQAVLPVPVGRRSNRPKRGRR